MEKNRQILLPSVLIVISVTLIIWSFFSFSEENKERIVAQNMSYVEDSTLQLGKRLDEVLEEGYHNIRMISTFYSQTLTEPTVNLDLLGELSGESVFDFMEYVDREGNNYSIYGESLEAADRQYYTDGMEGNVGMEVIFNSRRSSETLVMFYAPIVFEEEPIGVLLGVYQSANRIAELTKVEYFDENADVYLCSQSGDIIASNQPVELLDTREKINITNYIQDNLFYENTMDSLETGDTKTFTFNQENTIACITRLDKSGWYMVQIFPDTVNRSMLQNANRTGIKHEAIMCLSAVLLLIALGISQKMERKNLKEQAEKTESYKNAVLAGSMISFESNLTKNMITEGVWSNSEKQQIELKDILGLTLPCSYDEYIRLWGDKFVEGSTREVFLNECSIESLKNTIEEGKTEITFDYVTKSVDGKEIFARRSIYLTRDAKTGDIIFYCNVKDITEQRELEEKLIRESRIDELTKCYNRRSYEEDIRELTDLAKEEDLLYVSIDINGLKYVNDTMGHDAGDELITATAKCLKQCLGSYGKIYRTGGDEFIALLYVSEDRTELMKHDLAETVYEWKGKIVEDLSISCGYARASDNPGLNIKELAKLADTKMYDAKNKYYQATGLIRRKI